MHKMVLKASLIVATLATFLAGCDLTPAGSSLPIENFEAEFVTTSLNGSTTGEIELSWNPGGGDPKVYSYKIWFRSGSTPTARELVQSWSQSSGSYTHRPAEIAADDTYEYRVDAMSAGGSKLSESAWISVDVTANQYSRVPTLEVSNGVNRNLVMVQWSLFNQRDNLERYTGWRLYRSDNGGAYTSLGRSDPSRTGLGEYRDETVTSGNTYSYRLDAHYLDDEVVSSNIGTITFQFIAQEPVVESLEAPVLRSFTVENKASQNEVEIVIDDFENPNVDAYNAQVYACINFVKDGWPVESGVYWRIPIRRIGPSSDPIAIRGIYLEENQSYDVHVQLEIERGDDIIPSEASLVERGFVVDLSAL